jgi:hypothetical protein
MSKQPVPKQPRPIIHVRITFRHRASGSPSLFRQSTRTVARHRPIHWIGAIIGKATCFAYRFLSRRVVCSFYHGKSINTGVPSSRRTHRVRAQKGDDPGPDRHLHMFEDKEPVRGYLPGLAYCIPCTTLTSHTILRSRGFMVHVFDQPNDLLSLTWEVSAGGAFSKENLQPAYLSTRTNTGTVVRRVTAS